MTLHCPECEIEIEVEEPVEAGDIIECDSCIGAYLVEYDLTLTAGEVGDDGEFEPTPEDDDDDLEDDDSGDDDDLSEDDEDD